MRETIALARKELNSYFSSLLAIIFVGVFLLVTMALFFWVEKFWARGTADVRPLFEWLPIVMIFLSAALTMRQWSEEQQSGTLEMLLILPVRLWQLVLGKFLAVMALIALALALTFILPITVGSLGDLDTGPVIGGYVAALLLASAYVAVGLFVSSLTNNQIVSLIITVLLLGALYLVGAPIVTNEVNDANLTDIMRAIGSGSRFESIERGVIDLRDLVYFISITIVFLALNVWALDIKRWGVGDSTRKYRANASTSVTLIAVNLLVANFLLYPVNSLRTDLTENNEYSLSEVTRQTLENLNEPLLVTGYISEKTYPGLEPLIPVLRDTLEEYSVAADGNLKLEFVDPIQDPELEEQATQTYGIQPVSLPVEDRSGVQIVNTYAQILIRYGDQNTVLNMLEMVDWTLGADGNYEGTFRNLEYDLTSNIRKVVSGFQSVDAVLESLDEPATLTLYYTPDTLPEEWAEAPATIEKVANDLNSSGNLIYTAVDVNSGDVDPQTLFDQYGISPLRTLFSEDTFYMDMVLEAGNDPQVISPTGDFSEATVRQNIEAALKRAAPGFLTVVGIWTPPATPSIDQFTGQQIPSLQSYQTVVSSLGEENEVRTVDLSTGQVPGDIDVLLVIGPQAMTDIDRYAIDQYLMRGGTVFVAAGSFRLVPDQTNQWFGMEQIPDGLQDMLTSYGITVEPQFVMDTQNEPFPAPIVGGGPQDLQIFNYAYVLDVRQNQMDSDHRIVTDLPAITMAWVSPITLDETLNEDRDITTLLRSSSDSWLRTNTSLNINVSYPETGFLIEGERKAYPLAVVVEGKFNSFFTDKPSPFEGQTDITAPIGFITESPDTARLVVVGSAEFLNDYLFGIQSQIGQDRSANTMQFMSNVVGWSSEDTALSSIRARGAAARLLDPVEEDDRKNWEWLNYAVALVALVALAVVLWMRRRGEQPMPLVGLDEVAAEAA